MNAEHLAGLALIVVVAMTVWFNKPAEQVRGRAPVPTEVSFGFARTQDEVDGVFEVGSSGHTGRFLLADGQLYPADDNTAKHFQAKLTRERYMFDLGLDLGVWAAQHPEHNLETGLRYSPARILYGTTAPDLLVGQYSYGLGVSFFPPPDLVGRHWRHLGLGLGHLRAFDGGDSRNSLYVSFGTRF